MYLTLWVLFIAKIPFFSIENGNFAVTKSVTSDIPLYETVIWLKNMTDYSNDFLQFDIKYYSIQLLRSEFYSLVKYHFFSIENRKMTVTKTVISYEP